MTSDPDWWARGIGGAGFVLASLTLALNRFDSRWARRYAAVAPLGEVLEGLAPGVRNSQDPRQVQNLFSVVASARLQELTQRVEQVPDRPFRRHLRRFTTALTAFRGAHQAAQSDGAPAPLTQQQIDNLKTAKRELKWLTKHINVAAKRGSS